MTKEQMKSEIREMEKWIYPYRIYFGEHVRGEYRMGYFQDEQDGLWKGYEYMEREMGGVGYVFPTEEEALQKLYRLVRGAYEITRDVEELHRQWEAEDARARAKEER